MGEIITKEWLEAEIERLDKICDLCQKFGEVDGFTAAHAQRRALNQELSAVLAAE